MRRSIWWILAGIVLFVGGCAVITTSSSTRRSGRSSIAVRMSPPRNTSPKRVRTRWDAPRNPA